MDELGQLVEDELIANAKEVLAEWNRIRMEMEDDNAE